MDGLDFFFFGEVKCLEECRPGGREETRKKSLLAEEFFDVHHQLFRIEEGLLFIGQVINPSSVQVWSREDQLE